MANTKLFGKDLSQYEDVDIDELLEQLSPEELEMLAGEADPDVSVGFGWWWLLFRRFFILFFILKRYS